MAMDVEITKREVTETKTKVDVTFPIFLKHDGTWNSNYWARGDTIDRIDADGSFLELSAYISKGSLVPKFEVRSGKWDDVSFALEGFLRRIGDENSHTNDPTEFEALRQEILAALTG